MAASEYIPLYIGSPADARQYGESDLWEQSFRENVCCARAIEKAIREQADEEYHILPDCARSVLDEYGLKRTMYVLAHSVRTLGPLVIPGDEVRQWSREFDFSRDGDYGRHYRADTALMNLEEFIGQVREAYQSLGLLGKEHCDLDAWKEDLTGRVLILSPGVLRESCWSNENALWLATGGFGTAPNARGRAVYATNLSDGEEVRWNREDFVGVLDEKYLPGWAMERLEALRAPDQVQEQNAGPVMG